MAVVDAWMRDELDAAAQQGRPGLAPAAEVRGTALRRRRRRRVTTGVLAAVVALGAGVVTLPVVWGDAEVPLVAAPTPTPTAAPTTSPTGTAATDPTDGDPTTFPTSSPPEPTTPSTEVSPTGPPLDPAAVRRALTDLRFAREADWAQDVDFPLEVSLDPGQWHNDCGEIGGTAGALAARSVLRPGAHAADGRQLAVYADPDAAREAMTRLRQQMRVCHEETSGPQDDLGPVPVETTFVGGQLDLGDESFWVGRRDGYPDGPGELYFSMMNVVVLDRNVIFLGMAPASSDQARAAGVQELTAEWQALRPAYEALRR